MINMQIRILKDAAISILKKDIKDNIDKYVSNEEWIDDYFKAKKQGDSLESDIELKDKEMYDLKHELISAQIKLENAEKELAKMKEENNDLQMQIVKLETEMKNRRR